MQRVLATRNPALDLFGVGKHGFKAGSPGVAPATTPGYEFYNAIQEELANLVEGFGEALDPARRDQIKTLLLAALANKAPLASPVFTGAPAAPTAAVGTNTTQLANMAALQNAVQSSAAITSGAGGAADAITASYTPAITALTNGMSLFVRAASANTTTTPTFTPNNGTIAAKTIVKGAGSALAAGDIAGVGHWIELQYDQALDKWVLLNPATGISSGSGKIIASLFTATRAVVAASGDTTVMTLNFMLAQATPVVVDWRTWFGSNAGSVVYGDARLMLGATQKSRSSRIHVGSSGAGYAYNLPFNGSTYLGVLAAGSYTISLIWNNQSAAAAVFNPGPTDASVWSQADSEIIVRAAY
ncbi:hypothetical protein [Pseudogulbenkiania ferrooxidans]|uniref:Tail fiber protein n=1 Tax=Pseudogulbenkiania ferrooxidans 2002 TaxID=279714 RepID=B9Z4Y6_9NEIS|nr:hypothetical protein [Pseudogulbenkiania ferrooxidans]EEG08218.1 hypothetical protein FuraDRAFT_2421 [Pseudogulbenkiania ferrooxidans 2002]